MTIFSKQKQASAGLVQNTIEAIREANANKRLGSGITSLSL